MIFENLTDAENAYNELKQLLELAQGVQVGVTLILTTLIAKHPDYLQLQLLLTTAVEIFDTEEESSNISEKQRKIARAYVESVQQTPQSNQDIHPLKF
ncbi:MAG: hypothetical protein DID92_2727744112 [Candidatus Nitrotoga sp. SPKER]|nr:MAG: hypothetical protein DID92_2727744112 [Candidatus Nitrotoga sp. SPKER]